MFVSLMDNEFHCVCRCEEGAKITQKRARRPETWLHASVIRERGSGQRCVVEPPGNKSQLTRLGKSTVIWPSVLIRRGVIMCSEFSRITWTFKTG